MNKLISLRISKFIVIIILIAAIIGAAAFYAGMKYIQSKTSQGRLSQANLQNLQNLSPEERQKRLQELGLNTGARFRGNINSNGLITGEIIAKDDKSLTIKLKDGGSKIVFISESTEITKSVTGTLSDLEIGRNIIINGTTNPDGSITAQMIQLRSNY